MKPGINPKFRDAIRKLNEDELSNLEKAILKVGKLTSPILTWKGWVLDGHNRQALCKKLKIEPTYEEVPNLETEEDAIAFIKTSHRGRRNFSESEMFEMAMSEKEDIAKEKSKIVRGPSKKGGPNSAHQKRAPKTIDIVAAKAGMGKTKFAQIAAIKKRGNTEEIAAFENGEAANSVHTRMMNRLKIEGKVPIRKGTPLHTDIIAIINAPRKQSKSTWPGEMRKFAERAISYYPSMATEVNEEERQEIVRYLEIVQSRTVELLEAFGKVTSSGTTVIPVRFNEVERL